MPLKLLSWSPRLHLQTRKTLHEPKDFFRKLPNQSSSFSAAVIEDFDGVFARLASISSIDPLVSTVTEAVSIFFTFGGAFGSAATAAGCSDAPPISIF